MDRLHPRNNSKWIFMAEDRVSKCSKRNDDCREPSSFIHSGVSLRLGLALMVMVVVASQMGDEAVLLKKSKTLAVNN